MKTLIHRRWHARQISTKNLARYLYLLCYWLEETRSTSPAQEMSELIQLRNFICSTHHKMGRFRDVLPSQSLGMVLKKLNLTQHIVVWPTMSCFADWSKRRHVTLSIIICLPLHGHPGWHYNVTPVDVTWRLLNANVRYILRCFCLCFVFVFFGVLL